MHRHRANASRARVSNGILSTTMGPPRDDNARRAERRASIRQVPAITLRVDYKRMNTFFADYAKNISRGGTFVRTTKPLDVGTELVFVLSIPDQTAQLQLRGEVMWTVTETRATEEQPAGMGVRFRFANEAERAAVDVFVEKLMGDRLGPHVAAKLLGNR